MIIDRWFKKSSIENQGVWHACIPHFGVIWKKQGTDNHQTLLNKTSKDIGAIMFSWLKNYTQMSPVKPSPRNQQKLQSLYDPELPVKIVKE